MTTLRIAYQDEAVTLYHGDSRDVLPDLDDGSADLLLTDPPYGMSYVNDAGKGLRGDAQRQGIRLFRAVLIDLDRVLAKPAHAYIFCHWESLPDFYDAASSYMDVKNALVWDKRNFGPGDCEGDYAHDFEMVLFAHVGGRRLLNGGRDLAVRHHPIVHSSRRTHITEKPVDLLRFYIEKSTIPGETVLDPFAGSGATLIAARATGRRAIGIELDRKSINSAVRRLERDARRATVDPDAARNVADRPA